jgi:hypothetical protein
MNYSIDIPELFYSSNEHKPIQSCAICGKMLLSSNMPYVIEKAFKRNMKSKKEEMVFEYALCYHCQQNATKELSEESLKNIKMYFDLYVDFDKRQEKLGDPRNFKFNECIKNCLITNKPIEHYSEYQIGAYFFQNRLLLENPPYAMGMQALEEIQDLLSEKTRDFLDGFKDKIIPVDIRDKVPDDFLILL